MALTPQEQHAQHTYTTYHATNAGPLVLALSVPITSVCQQGRDSRTFYAEEGNRLAVALYSHLPRELLEAMRRALEGMLRAGWDYPHVTCQDTQEP